jgi:peptidoglycan/LPS O-acetylase OafA/YrhL
MAIAGNLEILRRCRWWIVGAGIALLSAAGLVPGYAFTSLSMVGVVSWTVAFCVLFFVCDRMRFDGEGVFARILSKMATLSFLAFLFHHQLLYLVQRHGKLVGNGDCLVWLVLADFVVAYFLAYLCSSPVVAIKALAFDSLKPKRAPGAPPFGHICAPAERMR